MQLAAAPASRRRRHGRGLDWRGSTRNAGREGPSGRGRLVTLVCVAREHPRCGCRAGNALCPSVVPIGHTRSSRQVLNHRMPDVAQQRVSTCRALRVGSSWSARLLKGAARDWVCLRLGAVCFGLGAASDGAGRGRRTLRRAVGVRAQAPAARALLRRLSGRLRQAGAGWARLARGSIRSGKSLRSGGTRVPHVGV